MISSVLLDKLSKSDKIIQLLKDHYNLCDWDKVTDEDFYTCISTEIPETVIEDGKRIVQVNYWHGDATLEFQDTEGESENWCAITFTVNDIEDIYNQLKLVLNDEKEDKEQAQEA